MPPGLPARHQQEVAAEHLHDAGAALWIADRGQARRRVWPEANHDRSSGKSYYRLRSWYYLVSQSGSSDHSAH